MRNMLKILSFTLVAFVALMLGQSNASAATFKIDIINGQDASGNDYGVITTGINSCTRTVDTDDINSGVISVASGQQRYLEVDEGCTQTLKVTVKEGYEIESILMDRQYVQITNDNTYTFSNINSEHAFCVKYKKAGTPNSPDTGDSAYVLPLVVSLVISLGAIVFVMKKKRNVKA